MPLLEICVDDAAGLLAAIEGGADRIELCSALELGGLTPSAGLIALARTAPVPVRAMIRTRPGDFVFSHSDIEAMLAEIATVRDAGLAGVALGASLPDGRLDFEALRVMSRAADGMRRTLHRAFDLVPDVATAVEQAVELGFDTILTSGGAVVAPEGVERLRLAHKSAAGRLTILAGAGLNADTVGALLAAVPLTAIHGSCSEPLPLPSAEAVRLGFHSPGRRRTSRDKVAALRTAMVVAASGQAEP